MSEAPSREAHGHGHHHGPPPQGAGEGLVKDPVCGMTVDPVTSKRRSEHKGQVFLFCSDRCRTKFEADPEHYLAPSAAKEDMPAGTIYTCPMHPEIRQVGPGSCPICGMALEPLEVTAEAEVEVRWGRWRIGHLTSLTRALTLVGRLDLR